jgi:hypothetical protein
VEASLIGPPTPHISAPKALVCLGWARAFLPRLLAPWSQLRACLPLRMVALYQGSHPPAQGWCPTTDRRGERVTIQMFRPLGGELSQQGVGLCAWSAWQWQRV